MFGRDGETRVVFQIVEFLQRPIWLVFGIVLKTCLKPLKGLTRKVDCRPAKLRQPKAHVRLSILRGGNPLYIHLPLCGQILNCTLRFTRYISLKGFDVECMG